ncbi:MAG: ribosomal-processing cysteine protease Prp [Selenomonadaceae bacterium]|nr:ribosomal-processing cysteine protease Prp [Selenomonadaceae bacterium]
MINIKISLQKSKIVGFEISGHANTAPRGQDIVCAGVSSISQTALMGIGAYLKRDVDYEQAPPDRGGFLSMKLNSNPDDLTEAILRTMILGLKEIERLYPKIIKIEYEEGGIQYEEIRL